MPKQSVPSSVGNISELLRNINCGYNENGPKVYCSDEISEFDDEFDEIYDDYDEEASGDYDYNNSSQLRGGVIDGLSMDGSTCQGSAVCYILKTDSFYVSKVHRRRRSISGSVFRVEVVGNCCWEAYERKRFRVKGHNKDNERVFPEEFMNNLLSHSSRQICPPIRWPGPLTSNFLSLSARAREIGWINEEYSNLLSAVLKEEAIHIIPLLNTATLNNIEFDLIVKKCYLGN
ncbi:unnamed protein product [Lepeophtheirus salmonis]|uniref:(salmon louse) hypothetical protein n=1 Tax=Lepeophtheirus salmonis TaxID=72036 RepID=A0A7R8CC91_LEPSM|nr:unnamed protein product [Lepeophtheirus salmonis]CAF2761250.1 unnamed protein product [Lepeophtheirus salmonis]